MKISFAAVALVVLIGMCASIFEVDGGWLEELNLVPIKVKRKDAPPGCENVIVTAAPGSTTVGGSLLLLNAGDKIANPDCTEGPIAEIQTNTLDNMDDYIEISTFAEQTDGVFEGLGIVAKT